MSEIASRSFLKDSHTLGIFLLRIAFARAGLIKALLVSSRSPSIPSISGEIPVPLTFLAVLTISRVLYVIVVRSNFASPIFSNMESKLELPSCKLYLERNSCMAADQSVTSRNARLCRPLLPVNELNVSKRTVSLPTLALYQAITGHTIHTHSRNRVKMKN